jgi:hypothetical protein
MKRLKKCQAPVRVELSGPLVDSISDITSAVAAFIRVLLQSLADIVVELKKTAIRSLRQHWS